MLEKNPKLAQEWLKIGSKEFSKSCLSKLSAFYHWVPNVSILIFQKKQKLSREESHFEVVLI